MFLSDAWTPDVKGFWALAAAITLGLAREIYGVIRDRDRPTSDSIRIDALAAAHERLAQVTIPALEGRLNARIDALQDRSSAEHEAQMRELRDLKARLSR